MDLVRDVLDKQLVDRSSDRLGKVDGLVVSFAAGEQARVNARSGLSRWPVASLRALHRSCCECCGGRTLGPAPRGSRPPG